MRSSIIEVNGLGKDYLIRESQNTKLINRIFEKKYTTKTAVKELDFKIEKGELAGFIGPNGAGKSTTIKMLTGILKPDRGNVVVNGIVPYENRVENAMNIGVVFGQRTQLWWDIPLSDTLNLMKYMYHIPEETYKKNLALYTEILGLNEFINQPVRQLSLGQRMRADIACSILHNPKVLYLDEPTIGLDVLAKEAVRKFIKEINEQQKTTILLTTHDMNDIERLCSRIMVIDKGVIVYEGTLSNLKDKYGFKETVEARGIWNEELIQELTMIPNTEIKQNKEKLLIEYDRRKVTSDYILFSIMKNKQIRDIKVHEQSLDGIIQELYQER